MLCKTCLIEMMWVRTTEDGTLEQPTRVDWFQCPECGYEEFIVSPIEDDSDLDALEEHDDKYDEKYWRPADYNVS